MSLADELRTASADVWDAQHAHPFVRGIGDGTLPEEPFRWYVRQDYRFLIDYGRLLSLGAARAPRLEEMRRFAGLAQGVLEQEMALHTGFGRAKPFLMRQDRWMASSVPPRTTGNLMQRVAILLLKL